MSKTKIELEDICKKYSNKKEDIDSFIKIYNFLFINQEFKGKKINLDDDKSIKKLANKFFNAKKQFIPSVPGTVPDTMVDNILHIYYKYNKNELLKMQKQHQHAMAAENAVGEFIELYLDSVLSKFGWIRCCGQIVNKTDFIKKEGSKYKMLQVKSRDNTENSSSSSVRDGTQIMKWFRYYAKTGKKNWENFPDETAKKDLSEEGFIEFVTNYANSN